ncbi:MAG: hypothetical protein AAF404_14800 [Pseudomonadota bacterium]
MRFFSFVVLMLFSPWCFAAGTISFPVYASVHLERQGISLSSEKFEPLAASAVIGGWVYDGIALELEFGTGIQDDDVATLSLETDTHVAAGIRLESRPVGGIAAYALFSTSNVSVSSRFTSGTASPDKRSFSGVRGVFGLTFTVLPGWVADAAFVRQEYDDDFGINGFRMGVRYLINNVRPRPRPRWL